MLIFDMKGPNEDKSKNGMYLLKTFIDFICLVFYTFYLFISESDGSNDSGTSSFGSDNKNNPESCLLNIPFIEVIKVK